MSNEEMNQQLTSPWLFEGTTEFNIPEKAQYFLYKITHPETSKWYIGRKTLYTTKYKQVKGKKKKMKVESDWRDYWSSSEELKDWVKDVGEDKFRREILLFVETSSACLYGEEALLYLTGALFDPLCLNGHIRTKVMRKWFQNKETDLHNRLINLPLLCPNSNQE